MKHEFLVTGFTCIVRTIYWMNIVEYVKLLSVCVLSVVVSRELTSEDKRAAAGIGIDLYQVAKFSVILLLLAYGIGDIWAEYITYYLISSNAFTYFYYHAWGSQYSQRNDLEGQRRRLLNFLLAITFYILCYAYLYQVHFVQYITWPEEQADTTNALYLSVANAFTLTYGGFAPKAQIARMLFMTELINTFFFFTILVSNSVPSIGRKE